MYDTYTINIIKHEVPLIFSLIENLTGSEENAKEFIKDLSIFAIGGFLNKAYIFDKVEGSGTSLFSNHVLKEVLVTTKMFGNQLKGECKTYIRGRQALFIDKCEFDIEDRKDPRVLVLNTYIDGTLLLTSFKDGTNKELTDTKMFLMCVGNIKFNKNDNRLETYTPTKDIVAVALDNDLEIWQYTAAIKKEMELFKYILLNLVD